jgi:hypothetical protein
VVGALTVANRTPGGFSADQRARLEEAALIGSAAVEIYLLRRDLAVQRVEAERERARLAAQMSTSVHLLQLSREMAAALAAGQGTAELMAIAAAATGGAVRFCEGDADGAVLLESGTSIEITGPDPHLVSSLAPTIAVFVSIALLYEHAIEDARHFREAELVERLVDPPPNAPGRSLRTGLAGSGDLDVVVVQTQDASSLRAALAALRNALGSRAISASRRGSLIVIARSGDDILARVSGAIGRHDYFGGVATAPGDAHIPAAFDEASLITRAMQTLRRPNALARRADLGVVAFAVGDLPGGADRFIVRLLGPVLGDASRAAALRETALHYLDSQGSVSTVADQLGVHENTVRQRLDRLDQLLPGWRSGPHSLDVHVALRAHSLFPAER